MTQERFFNSILSDSKKMSNNFPKKNKVIRFMEMLENFLFPVCKEAFITDNNIEIEWERLKLLMKELLISLNLKQKEAYDELIEDYFVQIPTIYVLLKKDAKAIQNFDPAAGSIEEIMMSYPGFKAITTYRLVHPMHNLQIPLLPRLLSEQAHAKTGIDINPGASIGESFFIDHGTGIVIGETTIIGNHVKIYQGVTLGALSVRKEEAKIKRHPTIEDNVVIYSGTTILGGNTVIGRDSVIGGNVWLTQSVASNSLVYHKSEIKVRTNKLFDEPISYVI